MRGRGIYEMLEGRRIVWDKEKEKGIGIGKDHCKEEEGGGKRIGVKEEDEEEDTESSRMHKKLTVGVIAMNAAGEVRTIFFIIEPGNLSRPIFLSLLFLFLFFHCLCVHVSMFLSLSSLRLCDRFLLFFPYSYSFFFFFVSHYSPPLPHFVYSSSSHFISYQAYYTLRVI